MPNVSFIFAFGIYVISIKYRSKIEIGDQIVIEITNMICIQQN